MTSLGMLALRGFINSRLDSSHSCPLRTSFHTFIHYELVMGSERAGEDIAGGIEKIHAVNLNVT